MTSRNTSATYAQIAAAALDKCFTELGGVDGLVEWAKRNPDKFYLFLWPRLLPKEIKATVDYAPSPVVKAVEVTDVRSALNTLEQMRYASDAYCGRGGSSDGQAMEGERPSHALSLPATDGGGTGSVEAEGSADAAETRQDDILRFNPPVPLPDTVSLAGSNVCDTLRRTSE